MNEETELRGRLEGVGENHEQDPLLDAALRNFRQSVHEWSDAAYRQPRAIPGRASRKAAPPWAMVSWALGLVLAAGVATTGIHERSRHLEEARLAAARQAEQQREAAAQRAKDSEDLLAKVDSDVSQEVPSALEPLAQMMTDDDSR